MRRFLLLSVLPIVVLGTAPAVQAQQGFIKENQVTEQAMIDALRPRAASAEALEPGMKTRSIKIGPGASGQHPANEGSQRAAAAGGSGASGGGSAPVLLTFETNSTELTARAKKALDIIARSLTREELAGLSFSIEGHADPRGKPEDNLRLSQLRAEAVKAYLVSQHNIAESRLNPVGKGSSEPAAPRSPSAAENRRVTFVTVQ